MSSLGSVNFLGRTLLLGVSYLVSTNMKIGRSVFQRWMLMSSCVTPRNSLGKKVAVIPQPVGLVYLLPILSHANPRHALAVSFLKILSRIALPLTRRFSK